MGSAGSADRIATFTEELLRAGLVLCGVTADLIEAFRLTHIRVNGQRRFCSRW
jgi:hypothetical protein